MVIIKALNFTFKCIQKCGKVTQRSFGNSNNGIKAASNKMDPAALTFTIHEVKVSKKRTTSVLRNVLEINEYNAYTIATSYKRISQTSGIIIRYNFQRYKEEGVNRDTILRYPILLAETQVDSKLEQLRHLPHNINDVIVLTTLNLEKLANFVTSERKLIDSFRSAGGDQNKTDVDVGDGGRITTLAKSLDTSQRNICEYLCAKEFLRTMSLEKINEAINVLLYQYGISKEDIIKDLWVLRYSIPTIKKRLNIAKAQEIEQFKTWMVRAQSGIYQTYIKRRSDNREVLGKNNTVQEYLSEKLECNMEVAQFLIRKQPSLLHKRLKKLSEIIEFLYSEGFRSFHICRVPKILIHSIETTKKRLRQLRSKGLKVESLYMLTKSQKQFNQYYETLTKSKKKISIK